MDCLAGTVLMGHRGKMVEMAFLEKMEARERMAKMERMVRHAITGKVIINTSNHGTFQR